MGAPQQTWPTVALIGHPAYLLEPAARRWVHRELVRAAVRLRDTNGMTRGLSGMSRGPGLWWADAVLRAHVDLGLHLPFLRQADSWPDADRVEWMRLMGRAGRAPLVYGATPQPRSLIACHRAMIDEADELLVVWQPGARGQVCDAVRYALAQGRCPVWIDPEQQWIHRPAADEWPTFLPSPAEAAVSAQAEMRSVRNRRDGQPGTGQPGTGRVANTGSYHAASRPVRKN
ncbi:hypothetical protein [Paractinoplanes durhamensis]|uniref:hypothetical protein n=1 Tax=Paractinoplanes durhamensis TaxID=113563 RepID=UPI001EF2BB02|nr:hypothetical protein [Actinoplanes durhamensis]